MLSVPRPGRTTARAHNTLKNDVTLANEPRVYVVGGGMTIRCYDRPWKLTHDVEIDGRILLPKPSVQQYKILTALLERLVQPADGLYVPVEDLLRLTGLIEDTRSTRHSL